MFQYRRKAGEEVVGGLRVVAIEAVRAREQNRADDEEHPRIRHQRSTPDEQRRHEHIGQVVDDVVQLGAVEPGNASRDTRRRAREHPSVASTRIWSQSQKNADAIVELENGTVARKARTMPLAV